MGYDRGDSFPFDFEPNGIPFDSKSKGNLSLRSYPIQCERKWKLSFLSVIRRINEWVVDRCHPLISNVDYLTIVLHAPQIISSSIESIIHKFACS